MDIVRLLPAETFYISEIREKRERVLALLLQHTLARGAEWPHFLPEIAGASGRTQSC